MENYYLFNYKSNLHFEQKKKELYFMNEFKDYISIAISYIILSILLIIILFTCFYILGGVYKNENSY